MAKDDIKTRTPSAMKKDAKAAIQMVFDNLGGVERLTEWANNPANTGAFYTQIWPKIIPKEVKGELTGKDGTPMRMVVEWDTPETSDE